MKSTKTYLILIIIIGIVACAKVPISGRRQVTLIPESELMSMSLVQYRTFLKDNPPASDAIAATKQVKRVGGRIAHAVEAYMKDNVFR